VSAERWTHTGPTQQVVVGSSAVDVLTEIVRALGMRRVLLLTTPGRAESEIADRVISRLGRVHAMTSTVVESTVPAPAVQRGVIDLRGSGADAIVALGGGAAIDTAKALAFFAEQEAGTPAAGFADRPVMPIVAVPTTLVGAAFTGTFSMVDPHTRRGSMAGGLTTVPVSVLADLDPLSDLSDTALQRSVAAALAQSIDVALDPATDPEARALAAAGVAALVSGALDPQEGPIPREVLDGSVLAGRSMVSSPDGLQRALVRLVAGRTGAPFGAVHAALAPHTTRVVSDVVPEWVLAPVASALRAEPDEPVANALERLLVGTLGATGLSTLGISDEDLDAAARQSASQPGVQRAARPLGEADVRALLDDAW
jgi:maleylacetate reductase